MIIVGPTADKYGSDAMLLHIARHFRDSTSQVSQVVLAEDGPLRSELAKLNIPVQVKSNLVIRRSLLSPSMILSVLVRSVCGFVNALTVLYEDSRSSVYINTVTIPLWIVAGRILGRPTIVHVHEILGDGEPLKRKLILLPLNLATEIVCVSNAVESDIVGAFARLRSKTTVVLNANFDERASPIQLLPSEYEYDQRSAVVVVGRLSPRKGQMVLLQAIVRMPAHLRPKVVFCGDTYSGYEWFERELRHFAKSSSLDVEFRGYVARDQAFRVSPFVCIPSVEPDPAPLVVLEAMANQALILAARTGGIPELLQDAGLYFDPLDIDELAKQIERAVTVSTNERAKYQRLTRERAANLSPLTYWRHLDQVVLKHLEN